MSNIIKLVKMNYINLKSMSKINFITSAIFIPISVINPMFLAMITGLVVFNLTYQSIAYEDTYGIDYLISYLPVKRSEYVSSRYLSGIVNILIGGVIFILCYYLAAQFSPNIEQLLDYKTTLTASMTSAVVAVSIIIPCILKLGTIKGRTLTSILTISIIMAPAFILQSLNEIEVLKEIVIKLSNLNFGLVMIVVNLLIIVISYFISQRIYASKEVL